MKKAENLAKSGKIVAVADIAYSNGGDIKFAKMLSSAIGLLKLGGYAGWNTSSNTLGTFICQSIFYYFYGNTKTHRLFTAERVYEDLSYCAYVRKYMWDNELEMLNCTFYNSNGQRGVVSERAEGLLNEFTSCEFPEIYEKYRIADC